MVMAADHRGMARGSAEGSAAPRAARRSAAPRRTPDHAAAADLRGGTMRQRRTCGEGLRRRRYVAVRRVPPCRTK
eukprot:193076-Chlamydomonas_euryale.AAC.2